MKFTIFKLLSFFSLFFVAFHHCHALKRYRFELKESKYTRLCSTKNILTVNGQFPGPTLYAHKGETFIVDVINRGNYNVTIHWHGVSMTRYPWSDGPEYITQCPIPPGGKFRQKVILSTEEGTLWWHAHSNWTRAIVHGAILVYPKPGSTFPFPNPHAEVPIILGEWWKVGIQALYYDFLRTGRDPNISDALLINGQPGDHYPCSKQDTFILRVDHGKTYLLRIINAVMQQIVFFGVANHKLTIVGSDASYTKPFTSDYIAISPGQTIDVILEANQPPSRYYMAAKLYERTPGVLFDKSTTTGIIHYNNGNYNPDPPHPPLPLLPLFNDTNASTSFTSSLRSLASKDHPIQVPLQINTRLFYTLSINNITCEPGKNCQGLDNSRLAASVNNISFQNPTVDLLQAYYNRIKGQYMVDFPDTPPVEFNYTAPNLPSEFQMPQLGTKVKVLDYNDTVELVFQGTSLLGGADHPMHLHGYSFYVVGLGQGNFDQDKDPLNYNLVDPPYQNTIVVPYNGWTAIRFRADNPGVWFMHCHLDRHATWGMDMAFIVKNGKTSESRMLRPPPDMPPC